MGTSRHEGTLDDDFGCLWRLISLDLDDIVLDGLVLLEAGLAAVLHHVQDGFFELRNLVL